MYMSFEAKRKMFMLKQYVFSIVVYISNTRYTDTSIN